MYQLKSLSVNHTHPEMIALALNDSMVPIFDQRNRKIIQRLLPGYPLLFESTLVNLIDFFFQLT